MGCCSDCQGGRGVVQLGFPIGTHLLCAYLLRRLLRLLSLTEQLVLGEIELSDAALDARRSLEVLLADAAVKLFTTLVESHAHASKLQAEQPRVNNIVSSLHVQLGEMTLSNLTMLLISFLLPRRQQ